jgi:hypothetical protein
VGIRGGCFLNKGGKMNVEFTYEWRERQWVPSIKLSGIPRGFYHPLIEWLNGAGFIKSGDLPAYGPGTIHIRANVED